MNINDIHVSWIPSRWRSMWNTGTACEIWNWLEVYCNWMQPIL